MKPDSVVRSTCPYCGVGCQVLLYVKDERIMRIDAPFDAAPNYGRLCVKGRFGTDYVHHPDRLTTPLIRRNLTAPRPGRRVAATGPEDWRAASWEEALDLVADRLLALRAAYGPDSITANACAKATNEDNYLLQKLLRQLIGTNNIDHCARLCHAGSVAGLQLAIGSSAMSNSIAEMKALECFMVIGSNTAETHPVIATFLKQAVHKNHATLIVVDPRQTEMTRHAALWLRQKPGTDTALFNAMAQVVVQEQLVNTDFVARRTEGFEHYVESLAGKTPEWAEGITGVPAEKIRRAARLYATASAAAMYWGMGISQSTHGTDNTLTLTNLALLCGQVGRPGTGLNPLRGQNNVQGCSDAGGLPGFYTAYQPVTDEAVRRGFEEAWRVPLPGRPGLTTTEMVDGILTGQVKGWYVMGENPLMSEPNLRHAQHAVEQLDFFVAQDIFFNESNVYADVILPAAGFAEKDGTYTNSDRRVQRGRVALAPPGQARADWEIISDLARRLIRRMGAAAAADGRPNPFHGAHGDALLAQWSYGRPEEVWEEMRRVTPEFWGITYQRLEREGGVHWPCPQVDHPGTPYLFVEEFPSGRGRFWPVEFGTESELPDTAYPFTLSTGRVLYHWHGGTMTRVSVLDAIWPECTVELHPHDAARLGLEMGDWVEVASRRGAITARLLVTGRSPEGTVFIPFHFAEAAANVLTDNRLDARAKIPDYKVCSVRVERAVAPPAAQDAGLALTARGAIKDPVVA
ncbi:MAG TPA: molybdopterin-dependent oxidoreductase [Anaerolineae bacterium]|nr:molybdopterin-dependent oxidoreductase [Anaerolineae bacterium]HNU02797.1 molybdopterin-dependent oxidoreductase [Anaerolineae bacterium]